MEVIKIAKKRTSGNEKISALNQVEERNTSLKAKAFDAEGKNALTKAEARRISRKTKEIDAILNKRKKQILKTHKVKPW